MTIKENLPVHGVHVLSGFTVLGLSGPDAEAFAQAQFMNDVRVLQPGQWQWSGWLNAKGRVIALFALLRRDRGELLLVLPDHPAERLAEALRRFVFRSKVGVAPLPMDVAGTLDNDAPFAVADRVRELPEGGLALDWGSPGHSRHLYLLPSGQLAQPAADARLDARWRDLDIAHGLPRLDAGQVEAWTPQMLSLQRLAAYSVKKGCYPGQEIVARTHFLGQAKRHLARLAGEGLAAGQPIRRNGEPAGSVVSQTSDGLGALAVLADSAADAVLDNGSRPCRRIDLLDGLQRGG